MKINGKTIDALLIAYGPDYKLYSNEGRYILQTGREKTVFVKEDPEYKIVSQFVVLKYQDISEQENIKNRFLELVGRLKNPSERYDRLTTKSNPYEISSYQGDSEYSINAKGDAVVGDKVRFEKAVFSGSFRSAKFERFELITGEIIKDSYGDVKQQHTFTLLLSNGEKMIIKGRNLYRNGLWRKPWINENEREQSLIEKHRRGSQARSDRRERLGMNPTSKKIDMRLFEVDSPLGKFQIIVTENVPGEWKKYGITDKNLRGDAIEIAQRELGGRGANVLPDAVKIKEIPEGFFPSKSMTAAYIKRKLANNPTVRRGSKLEKELESYESLFDRDEDEQQIDLNQLSEYEKMLTFSEKQNPKGVASITTKKLKEIMDEPFKRGTQGADFEAKYGIEEIESEYYKRISKEAEKEMKKQLKEQEQYEKSMAKKEKNNTYSTFSKFNKLGYKTNHTNWGWYYYDETNKEYGPFDTTEEMFEKALEPKPKKQFPITLNWEIYESLKETYAFLEIPDFPFYNVRIYFGNFFTVYVNDGYKTLKEKDFKTLDEAVDFAEREFLALVMNDKDYDVNIGSVVK